MNLRYLFISAAAFGIASSAVAAPVTKSYTVTSSFSSGPVSSLVQSFELTYDPLVVGDNLSLTNYSTSSNFAAFAAPVNAYVTYSTLLNYRQLLFSMPATGDAVQNGTNDFDTAFRISDDGNIFSPSAQVFYSYPGLSGIVQATTATVVPGFAGAAAVPEPATWVMMIVGMGAIGSAMRRRQRATIRFA